MEIVASQDRRTLGVRLVSAISFIRRIHDRRAARSPVFPSTAHRAARTGPYCAGRTSSLFLCLAVPRVRPRDNRFVQVDLPIADLDVVPAVGHYAHPSLVVDGRPLTAKVRKWYQDACRASLAQRKVIRFQLLPLPFCGHNNRKDTSPGPIPGVTYFIGLPAPPPATLKRRAGQDGKIS